MNWYGQGAVQVEKQVRAKEATAHQSQNKMHRKQGSTGRVSMLQRKSTESSFKSSG